MRHGTNKHTTEMKSRQTIEQLTTFINRKLEEGYYDFEVVFHIGNFRYLAIVSGNNIFLGSFRDDLRDYPNISRHIEDQITEYIADDGTAPGFTHFEM